MFLIDVIIVFLIIFEFLNFDFLEEFVFSKECGC